ncbi:MAG: hypothetical protein H7318_15245 [Oligoflexus sp.]|nr:hypothetical protein [Oligoflexus sp.]
MRYLPAILYHLLPLIPLAFGFYYLAVAIVMLVMLAYVKVHKLKLQEAENEKKGMKDPGVSRVIAFWERLTFLPRVKNENQG